MHVTEQYSISTNDCHIGIVDKTVHVSTGMYVASFYYTYVRVCVCIMPCLIG